MSIKHSLLLFLSPSSSLGGAERVLFNNLKFLATEELGIKQKVFFVEDGPLVQEVSKLNIPFEVKNIPLSIKKLGNLPSKKKCLIARWFKFFFLIPIFLILIFRWKKWLRNDAPALIHSNGFKTHIISGLSSSRETPVLWHLHDFSGNKLLSRWLLKLSWRPGIQAIAISRSIADDFHKVIPKCPVHIWYNSVDGEKFHPRKVDGSWLDLEAGFEAGFQGTRVGLVATYAKWKGHDVFLRACQFLSGKFKDNVRFYLIGGAIYQTTGSQWTNEEIIGMVRSFNLLGQVGLVPFQKDTSKVYQSLDVVVHASIQPEPFGLVITEAMACGKPVVASLHGGAAEIGVDGVHCVGHEPGNPSSLAAAMELLIRDEALRQKLGFKARERVLATFSAGKILPNWQNLLGEIKIK
jgi:glycosyltransferase involved in cell wall biosynthesis